MNLAFVYLPVKDLGDALALYRDTLGFEESWREGESACGLVLPGTDVQLMIDQDVAEDDKAGPFFAVDDVDEFFAMNQGKLNFNFEPRDIPPGRYVSFDDPSGNRIHVLDMSASREEDQPA